MKLTSVLLVILLGAVASGPALAGGGHSVGRSASPMIHGSHFHSSVRPGFVAAHRGHLHPHFRSLIVINGSHFHSSVRPGFVAAHRGHFHPHFRSHIVIIIH